MGAEDLGTDLGETLLRLGVAVLVGGVIGLNRDLRHKPAGLRTHALVALASALITIVSLEVVGPGDPGALTRTIQGIITGIGFLGAGVILHRGTERAVHGLTTAASVWVVATLGVGCGSGRWAPTLSGFALTLVILLLGGPVEKFFHRLVGPSGPEDEQKR